MQTSDPMLRAWLVSAAAAVLVFTAFPGIDVAASRLFWDGAVFPLAENAPLQDLRMAIWIVSLMVALAAAVGAGVAGLTQRPFVRVPGRCWTFILALYLLGPGLIVNVLLKPHWGRARPDQIEAFGGNRAFSAALWPGHQCVGNCSFSSGEAAAAATLGIALVLIVRHVRPQAAGTAFWVAVAVAAVGSGLRIVTGRHFLSDVVFSWLIVAAVALALERLIPRHWLAGGAGLSTAVPAVETAAKVP